METINMRKRQTSKYNLQILLTAEQLAELVEIYGDGHGLAAKCRSDILALARARAKRAGQQSYVAGVKVMGEAESPPKGLKSWLRDKLVEKYGEKGAAKILAGEAAEPLNGEDPQPEAYDPT
jgi:hypothetical protein